MWDMMPRNRARMVLGKAKRPITVHLPAMSTGGALPLRVDGPRQHGQSRIGVDWTVVRIHLPLTVQLSR